MNRKTQVNRLIIAAIAPFLLMGSAVSLQAQTPSEDNPSSPIIEYRYFVQLNKAKNLARQAAEKANGGLSQYRAESSMHGPPAETNHLQIAEGVWKFTFKGKRPRANNYSMESVVVVDTNDNAVTVEYNGPIRKSKPNSI